MIALVRRLGVAALLALPMLGVLPTPGDAVGVSVPSGPRLAVVAAHWYPTAGSEAFTIDPLGKAPLRLAGGPGLTVTPAFGARPAWSPDGGLLAFRGSGKGRSGFYVVRPSEGEAHLVPGSTKLMSDSDPVFAPDGRSLAFMKFEVVSGHIERPSRAGVPDEKLRVRFAIWTIRIGDGGLRPLTPWRREVLVPTSYSPDGTALGATALGRNGLEAVAVDLRSGRVKVLAPNAEEPVYSKDDRVAVVRTHPEPAAAASRDEPSVASSDLLVTGASGSPLVKVTRVRGGLAWPSWDPSGQRLAFSRLGGLSRYSADIPPSNAVMEVNADGSCLTRMLSIRRGFYSGVAWQPGPGREAGPIAC